MNSKDVGVSVISTIIKMVAALIVILLLIHYMGLSYSYGREIFNQTAVDAEGSGKDVAITVSLGESVSEIAADLKKNGLIEDKTLFRLQEMFSEYHGAEQAGTYTLNTSMKPDEMLKLMAGDTSDDEDSSSTTSDSAAAASSDEVEGNSTGTGTAEGEDMSSSDSTEGDSAQ